MNAYDRAYLKQVIHDKVIVYQQGKHEDWLFDFRLLLLQPDYLVSLASLLCDRITAPRFQLGGMESAALPLITAVLLEARRRGKLAKGFYIRKSRKKTGLNKRIEGNLNDDPIILIDDLINSGSSIAGQVAVLKEEGKKVSEILTIVQYRPLSYYRHLTKRGIKMQSLYSLQEFDLQLGSRDQYHSTQYNRHKTQWRFRPERATLANVFPRSTPAVTTKHVFFGSDDGYFYALDKVNGKVVWRFRIGYCSRGKCILSSPSVYNGVVYFGAYDGKVYALKQNTGDVLWMYSAAEWVGSSPAVVVEHNMLVIGVEYALPGNRGATVALQLDSGEQVWHFSMQALTHASPLYVPEHQAIAIGGNEGVLYFLDIKTGSIRWTAETEGGKSYLGDSGFSRGDIKLSPAYDAETDTFAISSYDGHVYQLRAMDGSFLRRFHTEHADTGIRIAVYGRPIYTKHNIIFGALDRRVYCYNKQTGEAVWQFETAGRIFASPVTHDGVVYIGSNDGVLYALREADGHLLAKYFLADRIVNPIVIDVSDTKFLSVIVITNQTQVYSLVLPAIT